MRIEASACVTVGEKQRQRAAAGKCHQSSLKEENSLQTVSGETRELLPLFFFFCSLSVERDSGSRRSR